MFTRLVKRASAPAQSLRSATLNNNIAIRNNGSNYRILRTNVVSIRHQSSSSSSRDNDNSNNQDIEPITSNEVPINASIELHRVDLAHGSFFAMHRPLLGIANGPMFANHNHNHLHEEDYEGNNTNEHNRKRFGWLILLDTQEDLKRMDRNKISTGFIDIQRGTREEPVSLSLFSFAQALSTCHASIPLRSCSISLANWTNKQIKKRRVILSPWRTKSYKERRTY
ncbi:MAG: hypothetical protein J3R72DRAFT_178287 [Linnemannia gamsii]|nr:MAG: hypothetical protein J3R72DRAFT_178287 [Linnemannia gamsii]